MATILRCVACEAVYDSREARGALLENHGDCLACGGAILAGGDSPTGPALVGRAKTAPASPRRAGRKPPVESGTEKEKGKDAGDPGGDDPEDVADDEFEEEDEEEDDDLDEDDEDVDDLLDEEEDEEEDEDDDDDEFDFGDEDDRE